MTEPTETEGIAASLLPMLEHDGGDGKRADYLAKRVSCFSMRESCQLAKVSEKSVHRWREADARFNYLDTEGMSDLRKKLSTEYIDMEFTRNFYLVLQKDFRILFKDATDETLNDDEKGYLLKIRQHYTPQSLAMVKQLLGGGNIEKPFDFTKLTLTIKKEQTTIIQEIST